MVGGRLLTTSHHGSCRQKEAAWGRLRRVSHGLPSPALVTGKLGELFLSKHKATSLFF